MAVPREFENRALAVLFLALFSVGAKCDRLPLGARRSLVGAGEGTVFDVTQYGAKGDGQSDDALKIIRAWNAACQSTGPAKLVIPPKKFLTGEIVLEGPCSGPKPMTIELQGTLLASTDLSDFSTGVWINIGHVDGLLITGSGTLDGQGKDSWKFGGKGTSTLLPVTLVFEKVQNTVLEGINVLNSKGYHMKVNDSKNVTITGLKITAPMDSPNTDGCHISGSVDVTMSHTVIGTGDDCISIGDGNTNVNVNNITCGPGHGISIGSLGKRPDELDVKGVKVTNCTFVGTTNGARIKTYCASPSIELSDVVYEDLLMDRVKNPIVIDQHYNSRNKKEPSKVKISDVHFRNIRGTTISPIAVSLDCSEAVPCEGIELADIDLTPLGSTPALSSACSNAKIVVSGSQFPAGCK